MNPEDHTLNSNRMKKIIIAGGTGGFASHRLNLPWLIYATDDFKFSTI